MTKQDKNSQESGAFMHLSFRKIYFALIAVVSVVFILYIARSLFIPLAYALLIAITLFPLVKLLTDRGVGIVWSILTVMIGVIVAIASIIYFFSSQILNIISEYDNFVEKLMDLYSRVISFINTHIPIIPDLKSQNVKEKLFEKIGEQGMPLISDTLSFTSTFLTFLVFTIIYIFLFLLHHRQFARGLTRGVPPHHRERFGHMLQEVQKVGQKYLIGMGLLMLIVGSLNTVGLLVLGIDYAFFFGFMASLLAIIPYVGTTLGSLLPTLYAFMTYDSYWYPLGVMIIFWFVQFIEGNFLSPNVVGSNLHLNAMAALIALISGGLLWGISGMILFLPMTAILKVICENYVELKPLAILMSDTESPKGRPNKLMQKLKSLIRKK